MVVTPDGKRRRAIGQILLLAAGLVVLTVISAGSVYLVNRAREDARWVLHTVEVENQLSLAQLQLRRAESAQRGYLSTLLPDFQTDFEEAASELTPALQRLGQLVSDNPVQNRLVGEMLPLANQRIEEFRNTIELARTQRIDDATRVLREGMGRDAMKRIDDVAGQMRAEENRLFIERTTNADRSQSLAAAGETEPGLEEEDEQLAQDFSEALEFIKSSIAKMDRLISAILNLTREGRREFEPVPVDTRELIEAIVTTVAHQAAEAEARIRIDPLPQIVSDRLALEQIFSNLLDNALKYLKPGVPGEISVRGRTKLGFAIFEVAANDRGIDPKDHQRMFDLFRPAGAQDKPGQGIGLAHVRALVRRLGGTMSVSSKLHQGSTFTITLPINWPASKRNTRT